MCPRDLEPNTTSNLISGRFLSKDYTSVKFEIFKKRLLQRLIHHFKSELINNMDHMRILGTEHSLRFNNN